MRLSGFKDAFDYAPLFDRRLVGHGDVRCVVGDLCERLTARLVGGRRHKTDCTADYCPDVSAHGTYFESKAVGRSNEAFVYGGRLEADREFSRRHRLLYVIWNHCADTTAVETAGQLERLVLASMRGLYAVPFSAVDAACLAGKPVKLNSKYYGGTDRETYGTGYRFRLSTLDRWLHQSFPEGLAP